MFLIPNLKSVQSCFQNYFSSAVEQKLEPWASKPARHYFEGLDMQRNE